MGVKVGWGFEGVGVGVGGWGSRGVGGRGGLGVGG